MFNANWEPLSFELPTPVLATMDRYLSRWRCASFE
jgi:hypothetical protein